MGRQRILIAGLVGLAAAGACHQAAPGGPAVPDASAVGGYTFAERLLPQSGAEEATIAGDVLILPDSADVRSQAGPCKQYPTTNPGRYTAIPFDCPGFDVNIDRRDPVHRSTYSMTTTVSVNESVCVQYAVDAFGRRTCVQTGIQPVEHTVRRTGYLHLHRKSG